MMRFARCFMQTASLKLVDRLFPAQVLQRFLAKPQSAYWPSVEPTVFNNEICDTQCRLWQTIAARPAMMLLIIEF